MKLLVETLEDIQYLTEDNDGKKSLYIEGVFLQSECKNRNGRIYPKSILEREVDRYIKEKVEKNCAWGELGHPDSPTINLPLASHRVIKLSENGNDWIGKARILSTPHGKIVESLISDGGRIGVSSRGIGTLKVVEGVNMVQDDYHLATAADIVADPSAPDAFVRGLMEQKEWVWNNGIIVESDVSKIHKRIKSCPQKKLEETIISAFKNYMEKL